MNDARLGLLALAALTASAVPASAQPAPTIGPEPSRPYVTVEADGRLGVRGADGAILVDIEAPPGLESPALSLADDGWAFTATYRSLGRREVLLVHRTADAAPARIAPPPGAQGVLRTQPLPLLEKSRLAGLAWLEGDDRRRLAVKAAAWSGEEWEAVLTVAPPAAGTQTALSGAILDDGT